MMGFWERVVLLCFRVSFFVEGLGQPSAELRTRSICLGMSRKNLSMNYLSRSACCLFRAHFAVETPPPPAESLSSRSRVLKEAELTMLVKWLCSMLRYFTSIVNFASFSTHVLPLLPAFCFGI